MAYAGFHFGVGGVKTGNKLKTLNQDSIGLLNLTSGRRRCLFQAPIACWRNVITCLRLTIGKFSDFTLPLPHIYLSYWSKLGSPVCTPSLHSSGLSKLKLHVGFCCFVEWYKYSLVLHPPPVLFFYTLHRSLVLVYMCRFGRTCGCNDLSSFAVLPCKTRITQFKI